MSHSNNSGRYNRRRFLQVTSVSGVGAIAGCLGGDETASLHFMTDQSAPAAQDVFEAAFEEWQETVDIEVESNFEYLGFEEVWTQVGQNLSAGNPPDLTLMRVDESTQYAMDGHMSDLSDVIEDINLDIPERMLVEFDGDSVFIPYDVDQASRWYRTDIYEEAGVEPATTWEEDLEVLETLDNHSDMHAMVVSASDLAGPTQWFYDTYMWSNGVHYFERDGSDLLVTIDQEPNRERAIETLEYIREKRQYSPSATDYSWGEFIDNLVTEQVTTTHYVGRIVSDARERNPTVYENMAAAMDPIPPNADGPEDMKVRGTSNGFAVPEEADNADLAKDFLTFYMNEYYIEGLLTVPLHRVPVDLDILDEDEFQQNEVVAENPEYVEFIKEWQPQQVWIPNRTDPPTPFLNALTNGSQVLPTMYARVLTGQSEPGEAVDAAAEELRDLIDEEFSSQIDSL